MKFDCKGLPPGTGLGKNCSLATAVQECGGKPHFPLTPAAVPPSCTAVQLHLLVDNTVACQASPAGRRLKEGRGVAVPPVGAGSTGTGPPTGYNIVCPLDP